MILRRSDQRGKFKNNWLNARYTFSFSEYYDPEWMGFGNLRVLNNDQVQPLQGFGTHGHKDMEIITYVLKGTIEHQDSMGNKEHIHAGEVQRMSAGSGVRHSEVNPEPEQTLELFQIWILPDKNGHSPAYEQKKFSREEKWNRLLLVVDPEGKEGALSIHAPARMYASMLEEGKELQHECSLWGSWLQLASGHLVVQDKIMRPGDGIAWTKEMGPVTISADQESEFIILDVSR